MFLKRVIPTITPLPMHFIKNIFKNTKNWEKFTVNTHIPIEVKFIYSKMNKLKCIVVCDFTNECTYVSPKPVQNVEHDCHLRRFFRTLSQAISNSSFPTSSQGTTVVIVFHCGLVLPLLDPQKMKSPSMCLLYKNYFHQHFLEICPCLMYHLLYCWEISVFLSVYNVLGEVLMLGLQWWAKPALIATLRVSTL